GEQRFLNFFFGDLRGILSGARGKVTVTRLHIEFFFGGEPDLQRVKAAVELEILRGETEDIGNFRRGASFAHGRVHIVAVVVELAACAVGKLRQNVLLGVLRLDAIRRFVTRGAKRVPGRIGDVAHVGGIQAAGVNGINYDVGPRGAIHQTR